jgi:site-specific DNA recombinase
MMTTDPARWPKVTEQGRPEVVEVPGIEPGSSAAFPGLLRAQFTVPLLGPTGHVN